jgi:hypothetical protein
MLQPQELARLSAEHGKIGRGYGRASLSAVPRQEDQATLWSEAGASGYGYEAVAKPLVGCPVLCFGASLLVFTKWLRRRFAS